MATEWYYALDGQQLGPISAETLKGMADQGQLQPTDLVWNESLPEWVAASRIPGLFPRQKKQPPPLPPSAQVASPPKPDHARQNEIAAIRRELEEIKASTIPEAEIISDSEESQTFGQWYQQKFGDLSIGVQILMWMFYGFLWIPISYSNSTKGRQSGFGSWYRQRFAGILALPSPVSMIVQGLMWLLYGFIWIPILYLVTHSETSTATPIDPRILALEKRLRELDPTSSSSSVTQENQPNSFPAWSIWCYFPYINWMAWVHAGIRSKYPLYFIFAVIYAIPTFIVFGTMPSTPTGETPPHWMTGLAILSWIIGMFHVSMVSKLVNLRIKVASEGTESIQELQARYRDELAGNQQGSPAQESAAKASGIPSWAKKMLFAIPGVLLAWLIDKFIDFLVSLFTG